MSKSYCSLAALWIKKKLSMSCQLMHEFALLFFSTIWTPKEHIKFDRGVQNCINDLCFLGVVDGYCN